MLAAEMIKKNARAFSYEAKRKPLPGEERSFNACQRVQNLQQKVSKQK